MDSREVAARLVELTLGTRPAAWPTSRGRRSTPGRPAAQLPPGRREKRPLLPIRMPGKAGKAYRAGDNLALIDTQVGKRTWEEFLAERVA
ncbi:hypothetical protein NKH18_02320 [Streptomyces sp. M10(2022)]